MTNPSGRILGIDYGRERIGISISDPLRIIASGLEALRNDGNTISRLRELLDRFEISVIVVGMPLTLKGEKGQKAEEVEKFIEKLRSELNIDVVTVDERLTSVQAKRTMLMMGTTKKQRRAKGTIDEMASALILQSYLDSR